MFLLHSGSRKAQFLLYTLLQMQSYLNHCREKYKTGLLHAFKINLVRYILSQFLIYFVKVDALLNPFKKVDLDEIRHMILFNFHVIISLMP